MTKKTAGIDGRQLGKLVDRDGRVVDLAWLADRRDWLADQPATRREPLLRMPLSPAGKHALAEQEAARQARQEARERALAVRGDTWHPCPCCQAVEILGDALCTPCRTHVSAGVLVCTAVPFTFLSRATFETLSAAAYRRYQLTHPHALELTRPLAVEVDEAGTMEVVRRR